MKKFITLFVFTLITLSLPSQAALIPPGSFADAEFGIWTTTTPDNVMVTDNYLAFYKSTPAPINTDKDFAVLVADGEITSSPILFNPGDEVSIIGIFDSNDVRDYPDVMDFVLKFAESSQEYFRATIASVLTAGDFGLESFEFLYISPIKGLFTVGLEVGDVGDKQFHSVGLVQEVHVNKTTAVPAPPALAMLSIGLLFIGGWNHRRNHIG